MPTKRSSSRRTARGLAATAPGPAPALGERTGNQRPGSGSANDIASQMPGGLASMNTGSSPAMGVQIPMAGFSKPGPGTYQLYRTMRANPSVALARMAATAPIKATEWTIDADEDADENAIELITDYLTGEPLRQIIRNMLLALDYGWSPFEVVWDIVENQYQAPVKLKPLLVDITDPIIDKATGMVTGLKNGKTEIDINKSMIFTYDGEAGDVYGRSRHENIRKSGIYNAWNDLVARIGQYTRKVAGVTAMMRFPEGETRDKWGQLTNNYILAVRAISQLGKGEGVVFPSNFSQYAPDMAKQGVDVEKLYSWNLSFLESKGTHGSDMDTLLRSFDRYLIRGWLTPERTVSEGQFGTKAEAETHTDFVFTLAEEVAHDVAYALNTMVIDQCLELNFGPDARGTIRLKPSPLNDASKSMIKGVVTKLLEDPGSLGAMASVVDMTKLIEQSGMPTLEGNTFVPPAAPVGPSGPGLPGGPTPAPVPGGGPQPDPGPPVGPTVAPPVQPAYVTAVTNIIKMVEGHEIPRDSALQLLVHFFGMDEAQASLLLGEAGKGEPPAPKAPANQPPSPGGGNGPPPAMAAAMANVIKHIRAQMITAIGDE